MESKASYHRGECLAFVTCLIRHFSLVCLLAVLIFSPKASFATTVQGTTAYSSSAEAQTQINTLIAADIAAHPGASRSGNSVQWEEGSYDVKMRTSRNYSIRTGITGYGGYTSGNVYEVGAFVGGGQQIGATNNLAGPYPVSMSGYSTLVAARAAMQAYLQDVVYASLPSTVPHPIYPAFPMAKQPISAWIYWPNTYSLTVQYLDTTHNFARYVTYTGIYFQLQTP